MWNRAFLLALIVQISGNPLLKAAEVLPGTEPLTTSKDFASEMVSGIDRFLLRKIDQSIGVRQAKYWNTPSVEEHRARLLHILGVRDDRIPFDAPNLLATTGRPSLIGAGTSYNIFAVSWPVVGDMQSEGLLLVPRGRPSVASVIAIPDADHTPEMLAGLSKGVAPESQFARRLAENGCRVLIPTLISRRQQKRGRSTMTDREFLYRPAFELGRHLIGYEIQKVLAGIDWFEKSGAKKIGVAGYGEGGMLALYAAASDSRIGACLVSGHFMSHQTIWQEPLSRNVFGYLERFGDAEVAALHTGRPLVIEASIVPQVTLPSSGGAPGRLRTPTLAEVQKEVERVPPIPNVEHNIKLVGTGTSVPGSDEALNKFLTGLLEHKAFAVTPSGDLPELLHKISDADARQQRLVHQIDRHNQRLLAESSDVRRKFMAKLDTSSMANYQKSVEPYREYFATQVIGRFDDKRLPPKTRTRKIYDEPKYTGYEVLMDVYPDVIAYGILLMPKGIPTGEQRPVVVCQHGLEGRPQNVADPKVDHRAYHRYACRLAEQGMITFSPQNPYIFGDRFRTLQRKANPLGKTLFSVIVPQHQQITDWLGSLPQVTRKRIAFYGLSYGGKTAMRVPPLVDNYCLSICSADFNEWVWKNASTKAKHSYVWTGEYEIFEFNLGNTFNYAEMAALICPRPFMVERGHFDGVSSDEAVAYEYAKVRHLYQAKLGLGDRTEIEWFVGPHTINGVGTFKFLQKHLK